MLFTFCIIGSKTGFDLRNCAESLESHLGNLQRKIDVISTKLKNVWISSNPKRISYLKVNGKFLFQISYLTPSRRESFFNLLR